MNDYLKKTADSLMEKAATPEELAKYNYRTLLGAVSALAFKADHCDFELMPPQQVRDILKRIRGLAERKDVRQHLCDQISPEGSGRRP